MKYDDDYKEELDESGSDNNEETDERNENGHHHVDPHVEVSEESEIIKPIMPEERNPRKRRRF